MSIFGSIMSKIFGGEAKAEPTASSPPPTPTAAAAPKAAAAARTVAASPAASPGAPAATVDVDAVLTQMASHEKQKLDWRHSIVDLMKLLDLDSSLAARKELAGELHYTGSTDDSAAMNIWLHKQVMIKLAENGGKVPEDMRV